MVDQVADLVVHLGQVGEPPLDGRLGQVGGQGVEELLLAIAQQALQGVQLVAPPRQRPGGASVEGGAQALRSRRADAFASDRGRVDSHEAQPCSSGGMTPSFPA